MLTTKSHDFFLKQNQDLVVRSVNKDRLLECRNLFKNSRLMCWMLHWICSKLTMNVSGQLHLTLLTLVIYWIFFGLVLNYWAGKKRAQTYIVTLD